MPSARLGRGKRPEIRSITTKLGRMLIMGSPRKIMMVAAIGASLVALTTLGAVRPMTKTTKPSPGASCCAVVVDDARCFVGTDQLTQGAVLLGPIGSVAIRPPVAPQKKASQGSLDKGVATRKALMDQATSLMEEGVADCCMQPACGLCPISADACDCAESLSKGGAVCPECWGGWQAGHGGLPNVKPEDVKVFSKDILKQIYDSRAEKLKEANK